MPKYLNRFWRYCYFVSAHHVSDCQRRGRCKILHVRGLCHGVLLPRVVQQHQHTFQTWTMLVENYHGNQNDPTNIRTECRKAGHEWAGKTGHETKRRAVSRRSTVRYSWARVAIEEKVLPATAGGASTNPLKQLLGHRFPEIVVRDPAHEPRLREACRILKTERTGV